ncbi:MAG TPA: FKBP-type peptidyl-prolyl cis-trans isomerase [Steroidobacteraceae bacterium]|nr:FKBP-type peptidyl-prolyl cis-trans isomerase [Steroidobacteraceae bacterium]
MKTKTLRLAWPLALMLCAACNAGERQPAQAAAPTATTTAEGLAITELAAGEGAAIAAGSTAVVHYTGWLYESGAPDHKGRKFDSSVDRGEPFRFTLGAGEVIRGWDLGVEGMKKGSKRRLVIPAALAYGEAGAGGVIPPGATLVFDVELLGIESAATATP